MKKTIFVMFAVFMIFGFSTAASAAPVFSFDIEFDDVNFTGGIYDMPTIGSTAKVEILFNITGSGLLGSGFNLSFDPTQLEGSNFAVGAGWTPLPGNSGINNTTGNIFFEAAAFTPIGPGDGIVLASWDFECTGYGLSSLIMDDLNDQPNWLLADGTTVIDGELGFPFTIAEVNQVPIPGALWLLGSGLLGLIGLRRRVKK